MSPDRFEQPEWVKMYINVVLIVLSFGTVVNIMNCLGSILIEVYRCAQLLLPHLLDSLTSGHARV